MCLNILSELNRTLSLEAIMFDVPTLIWIALIWLSWEFLPWWAALPITLVLCIPLYLVIGFCIGMILEFKKEEREEKQRKIVLQILKHLSGQAEKLPDRCMVFYGPLGKNHAKISLLKSGKFLVKVWSYDGEREEVLSAESVASWYGTTLDPQKIFTHF